MLFYWPNRSKIKLLAYLDMLNLPLYLNQGHLVIHVLEKCLIAHFNHFFLASILALISENQQKLVHFLLLTNFSATEFLKPE